MQSTYSNEVMYMWKQLLIGRPLTLKQRATQTVTKKEAQLGCPVVCRIRS